MRRKNSTSRRQGGFALLIVVILVALIGVAAVALLDIVNVDLLISGQHRRNVDATSTAIGAMYEVVSDERMDLSRKPLPTTPNLTFEYARRFNNIFGASFYIRDPQNTFGAAVMGPNNSAFVRNVGTAQETGYSANISLLRTGVALDTGLNRAVPVIHETQVTAFTNRGGATKEVRAVTTQLLAVQPGRIFQPVHAR